MRQNDRQGWIVWILPILAPLRFVKYQNIILAMKHIKIIIKHTYVQFKNTFYTWFSMKYFVIKILLRSFISTQLQTLTNWFQILLKHEQIQSYNIHDTCCMMKQRDKVWKPIYKLVIHNNFFVVSFSILSWKQACLHVGESSKSSQDNSGITNN